MFAGEEEMKRARALAAVVALGMALVVPAQAQAYTRPTVTRPPAAVSITGTETCVNGYIEVDGTIAATVPGTYDVVFTGDLASYQAEQYVGTYTLAAGQSAPYSFGLGSGQHVNVVVYNDVTGARVASKDVAAASVCTHSW